MRWGAQGFAQSTTVVVGLLAWSRSMEMAWCLNRCGALWTYCSRAVPETPATPDYGEWLQNFRKPMGKSWDRRSTAMVRTSPPQ